MRKQCFADTEKRCLFEVINAAVSAGAKLEVFHSNVREVDSYKIVEEIQ